MRGAHGEESDFGLPAPARPDSLPLGVLHAELRRLFFGFSALASLCGAVLLYLESDPVSSWLGLAFALHSLLAIGGLAAPKRWLPVAMPALVLSAMGLIAAMALWMPGPRAGHGLPLYGPMLYLLFGAAGRRAGTLGGVTAVAMLALVHAGPGAPPWPAGGLPLGLGGQLLGVLIGWVGGFSSLRLLERLNRRAEDREDRFRRLLGVAAAVYWETDRGHHLVVLLDARTAAPLRAARQVLGRIPWEAPGVVVEPETLDTLLADIGRGEPFRDARLSWAAAGESTRHWLVSGEPRHDEEGQPIGYWGVAREITDELRTRVALDLTRERYHELFDRNPSPLLVHRGGRVIDANPAALAMLGHTDLADVQGMNLLALFASSPQAEHLRERLAAAEALPAGAALPVAEFRLQAGERELTLRSTSVRVQMDDGPAVMTIGIDDTERVQALDQLRGSKAMLEHLVATSPDLITLTEAATGRYMMVNRSFERTTGWSASDAIGRTSTELGIWHSLEERATFVDALREGSVELHRPLVFRRRDGRPIQLMVSGGRFVLDGREYLVLNGRDVTEAERERVERAAILDSASVGIAVTRQGRFVIANRSLERMLGWPAGALVGQPSHVQWPDRATYDAVVARVVPMLKRGEPVDMEHTLQRRDGTRFLATIHGRSAQPGPDVEAGFVWCVEDVTELREAERQLARARDSAEAANRAKTAFLANTSHELRTPLNAMLGFAQLAADPALEARSRAQYLEQIVAAALTLSALIGDILDLSQIESGRLEIDAQPFELGTLLRTLVAAHEAQAAARGLELALDLPLALESWVRGDPLRLRQILGHYLSNAFKFTDAGRVTLRVADAGPGRLRFTVVDTGHGIAAAALPGLFQPFSPLDASTTRRYGGAGLGLALCRELATVMKGAVGVDSVPGQGSRFWLELPMPAASPTGDVQPATAPDHSPPPEPGRTEPVPPVRQLAPAAPVPDAARPLAGLRVLVAEDHEVNMLIAVAMLERWGAEVVQVTDGGSAVAAVQAAARGDAPPLDLVLMDLQMPVLSGYEATQRLREDGARLPVIALTAAALVGERERARAAGLDDFLTKPIDAAVLRDTLLHWVGRRRADA